jgi:hypothetical protein
MTTPNDPLDPLLRQWGNPPPQPPLKAEVWRRIAAAESAQSAPGGWRQAVAVAFARPSFAVAFVAACMLLGLFLAEVRVTRMHEERDRELLQSYRRLIDPLVSASTPAHPEART